MMKIWYDCEFIESPGKVELISIGMIDEDDNELYCESSEFKESDAGDWVKENVIPKLLPKKDRLTREEIKDEILNFVGAEIPEWWGYVSAYDHVVLCQIFGVMVDLPSDWPCYTRDIKQIMDTFGWLKKDFMTIDENDAHNALFDAKWTRDLYFKVMSRVAGNDNK